MLEHDPTLEKAFRFSRFDSGSPFSTVSAHSFELEEYHWPTVEHYYQAHKFEGLAYAAVILSASSGDEAYRLGNAWFKRKVSDWKNKRRVWMTRAFYRKAMEHKEVKQALLDTEEALLIETSLYGHYWGIGRDQRGENIMGKIWMDIREKLKAN